MNILFVTTASITAEAFLLELALSLKKNGYNVEFAFSYDNFSDARSSVEIINEMGFLTHAIPFSRKISIFNDFFAYFKLLKLIRSRHYNLIHSHTSKAGFITRLTSPFVPKSFFIHTSHDFYFREFSTGFKRHFFIQLERFASYFCDKLFFVSNEVYNDALAHNICKSSKAVFVSNGIPTNILVKKQLDLKTTLGLNSDTIIIGTVARLVKNKGLDIFIETARRLVSTNQSYYFIICGSGPEKNNLTDLIKKYDLIESVHFFDFFDNKEDLFQVFLNFDCFFFPTLREGLGLVILESLYLEVPVVTTDLPPMNEIIKNNFNGMLAERGDSIGFSKRINQIFSDDTFKSFLIKNGYNTVLKKYDLRMVNDNIINLYKSYVN